MTELNPPTEGADDIGDDASRASGESAPPIAEDAQRSDSQNHAQGTQRPDVDDKHDLASTDAMHVTHRGVVLTVAAHRNAEGAWLASISAHVDGKPLDLPHVEPATPEWLTESEALRAGIEHGCYLVDRYAPHR